MNRTHVRRMLSLAAAGLLALLVVVWLRKSRATEPRHHTGEPAEAEAHARSSPSGRTTGLGAAVTQGNEERIHPSMITDIAFDKETACENEPVTVQVGAHDPDGDDRTVSVSTATGIEGNPLILTFATAGDYPLMFIAHNGRGVVDQKTWDFKVKDCGGAFSFVDVNVRRLRVPDIVAFFARPYYDGKTPAGRAAAPREAEARGLLEPPQLREPDDVTFVWDFGDGTGATTATGYVEHDFGSRPQDRRQSSFIVRVDARSQSRGTITGLRTVAFVNVHFLNRERGVVAPAVSYGPVTRDGREFVMPATIRNPHGGAIPIRSMTAGLMPCIAPGQASAPRQAIPAVQNMRPGSILGTETLPPGEVRVDVRFPTALVSDEVCQVYFWGSGKTSDGLALDLQISMMVVGPKPVPIDENDPNQAKHLERVRRAAQLLGRTGGPITGEDILRLEQQGKL